MLEAYFDKYYYLSNAQRKKTNRKYKPEKLFIERYDYSMWSKNEEESTDKEESIDKKESVELPDTPQLEVDEEVKKVKRLTVLTPNKLLTRLPILLAQIKAGNNTNKLKNEITQILYLLYQHNKIIKKVYNNLLKSL